MALDELVATIEELKSKISDHRASISSSETRTRQVLIDPLLMELGWDVTDPTQVTLEYSAGQGKADYALLGAQGPVAVVEAKRLGENLGDNHVIQQGLNYAYANLQGIAYIVLSNGDEWRMYDVFRWTQLSEPLMMELKIGTTSAHETALKSLTLWRANLGSGTKPIAAHEPFISDTMSANPRIVNQTSTKSAYQQTQFTRNSESSTSYIHDVNTDWIPIDDQSLYVTLRTRRKVTAIKIQGVIQPKMNGSTAANRAWAWADFTQLIAKWLVDEDKLKPDDCPVFVARSTNRCFINDRPTHPDGKHFFVPRKLPHGMWVDANNNSQRHLEFSCRLLRRFGVNPNVVEIKVE